MKPLFTLFALTFIAYGCHNTAPVDHPILSSIQILDRNGITETISTEDRVLKYESVNFSSPQPFHQVLRMYKNNFKGQTPSILTNYHPNGYLHQYLEIVDGRAHGEYKKWHENGKLHIEATVIEGPPTFSMADQESWVFDGLSKSYDVKGNLICEIPYEKGSLEGEGLYYHNNGALHKRIPYSHDQINGVCQTYYFNNSLAMEEFFENGQKNGITKVYGKNKQLCSWEEYKNGLLISAKYYDPFHNLISTVEKGFGNQVVWDDGALEEYREIKEGVPEGLIRKFNETGQLYQSFFLIKGKKNGEEIIYDTLKGTPRLSLNWKNDLIHGKVKSWYDDGALESQKEYSQNKKHGISCVWYPNGKILLHEEYENDSLRKGSYFDRTDDTPVSAVIQGNGIATLYDKDGIFLKKVRYKNGSPEEE